MATVLDVIWVRGNKYFSENPKKRLDNPVKKPPDGQITKFVGWVEPTGDDG